MTVISPHIPVLRDEMIAALAPANDAVYVDATFGAGGYARAILQAAQCRVCAFDRDPRALALGAGMQQDLKGRLILIQSRFGEMAHQLTDHGVQAVDGVVFDLGVSSMQLDEAERGFSFLRDGPLDMRMDSAGESAADLVNRLDEAELADILFFLGEERQARAIARAILIARQDQPFTRTGELAALIARIVRGRPGHHPATRSFQALRIAVNDELGEIARALAAAEAMLHPGGRLVVVTFHSLEDRLVKDFLARRSGRTPAPSRHLPPAQDIRPPSFELMGGAVAPTEIETRANPRARSAKLRAARRTHGPAWPIETDRSSLDWARGAA